MQNDLLPLASLYSIYVYINISVQFQYNNNNNKITICKEYFLKERTQFGLIVK